MLNTGRGGMLEEGQFWCLASLRWTIGRSVSGLTLLVLVILLLVVVVVVVLVVVVGLVTMVDNWEISQCACSRSNTRTLVSVATRDPEILVQSALGRNLKVNILAKQGLAV